MILSCIAHPESTELLEHIHYTLTTFNKYLSSGVQRIVTGRISSPWASWSWTSKSVPSLHSTGLSPWHHCHQWPSGLHKEQPRCRCHVSLSLCFLSVSFLMFAVKMFFLPLLTPGTQGIPPQALSLSRFLTHSSCGVARGHNLSWMIP